MEPVELVEPVKPVDPYIFVKESQWNKIKNTKTSTQIESSFLDIKNITSKEKYVLIVFHVQL